MAKSAKKLTPADVRALREFYGENQSDFWNRVGITQSGGSRYESSRPMPGPVRLLVGAIYSGEVLPKVKRPRR